jgi:hypothetical protein
VKNLVDRKDLSGRLVRSTGGVDILFAECESVPVEQSILFIAASSGKANPSSPLPGVSQQMAAATPVTLVQYRGTSLMPNDLVNHE